jgi:hypothetical protein
MCKRASVYVDGSPDVLDFYGSTTSGGYVQFDKKKDVSVTKGDCAKFESLEEASARCFPAMQAGVKVCGDWLRHNWPCKLHDMACAKKFSEERPRDCMQEVLDNLNSCFGAHHFDIREADDFCCQIYRSQ